METIDAVNLNESRWLTELRNQCEASSQPKVASKLGYSPAVINQVLKGNYKGDLNKVEQKVRGAFLGETVGCPVIGELEKDKCISNQGAKFSSENPLKVQLFKTCPNCQYNTNNTEEEAVA